MENLLDKYRDIFLEAAEHIENYGEGVCVSLQLEPDRSNGNGVIILRATMDNVLLNCSRYPL